VLRNYPRKDIPAEVAEKVFCFPLGYARHAESRIDVPWVETPSIPFREQIWSFYGTGWMNREEEMKPLRTLTPYSCKFYKDWLGPDQLKPVEYVAQLLNSIFVPCPAGQNPETFRFYEALEHGAIPLCISAKGDAPFVDMVKDHIPWLGFASWADAGRVAGQLLRQKEMLENHRAILLSMWASYKTWLRTEITSRLREATKVA
jgi:hypothetical protein